MLYMELTEQECSALLARRKELINTRDELVALQRTLGRSGVFVKDAVLDAKLDVQAMLYVIPWLVREDQVPGDCKPVTATNKWPIGLLSRAIRIVTSLT